MALRKDLQIPNQMDKPELITDAYTAYPDEGGVRTDPFVKFSFYPQPTSGGEYEETQEDILFYLRMSDENAKQIWEWVTE